MTNKRGQRKQSFVRRDGRETPAQKRARQTLWPQFGLQIEDGIIDYAQIFGRSAPCYLEIGFGSGHSLLALAKAQPELNLIGVETHKPGIGALMQQIEQHQINNIHVYDHDVVEILEQCIPNASLDGLQIFFPDPWPKRRHHPRRLIQPEFIRLVVEKLKAKGTLHLATDWEDYAKHMLQVLSAEQHLQNLAGMRQFATRSAYRPIVTKFERRAQKEGREIWELQFMRS
jgi:tRNA (guanine-N7-)-methyltransferase